MTEQTDTPRRQILRRQAAEEQLPIRPRIGRDRTDFNAVGSLRVASDRERRIRDRLLRRDEQADIDLRVDIGQPLPPRVRVSPLPEDIVRMAPDYRGYDYAVARRQIVIVEPGTHRVVDVIRQDRGPQAVDAAEGDGRVRLTMAQRRQIVDYARSRNVVAVQPGFEVQGGVGVPQEVELAPLPAEIVTEVPAVQNYDFFVTGEDSDQIVLVDPDTRAIVEIEQ